MVLGANKKPKPNLKPKLYNSLIDYSYPKIVIDEEEIAEEFYHYFFGGEVVCSSNPYLPSQESHWYGSVCALLHLKFPR